MLGTRANKIIPAHMELKSPKRETLTNNYSVISCNFKKCSEQKLQKALRANNGEKSNQGSWTLGVFTLHDFLWFYINSAFSIVKKGVSPWPFTFPLSMATSVHLAWHGHTDLWQEDAHGTEIMVGRRVLGFYSSKPILDGLVPFLPLGSPW